jgi:hypothetical protein
LAEILKKLPNVTVDVYTFNSSCEYFPEFSSPSANSVIDYLTNQVNYDGGSDLSCINVLKVIIGNSMNGFCVEKTC